MERVCPEWPGWEIIDKEEKKKRYDALNRKISMRADIEEISANKLYEIPEYVLNKEYDGYEDYEKNKEYGIGKEEKWRCHKKGRERYFYWAYRYEKLGDLVKKMAELLRRRKICNEKACEIFYKFAKRLPRWKWMPEIELLDENGKKRKGLPRWMRGKRAAILFFLFKEPQVYKIACYLLAMEEGKSPHTIYRGIKKARSFEREHKM